MIFKEKSFYQYSLLPDEEGEQKWVREKVTYFCDRHRFAKESDSIEVFVKRSKTIVKRCIFCEREKRENKKVQIEDWKAHKENLTDYYVRRMLSMGTKNPLPLDQYPKDLVEAKKVVLQLKREIERLKKPIKKCFQHGDLFIDDVVKAGKHKSGRQAYKCKFCLKEFHDRHYELNKTKVALRQKNYRLENKEHVKEIKKASYKRNKHKYIERDRERTRNWEDKQVKELGDRYIKKLLVKRTSLSYSDLSPELIDAMRAIQQLKRGIKKTNVSKKLGVKPNVKD